MGMPILTLLILSPVAGAVLLALLPREPVAGIRRAALVLSLVPFALSRRSASNTIWVSTASACSSCC